MFDELLARNAEYAAQFPGGDLPPQPAKRLAVLTCMDSRIDPWAAFGLNRGEAHVLRNAGARLTGDVRRSLAVSVHVLGVRAVAIVAHTGCGMVGRSNAEIRRLVAEGAGTPVDGWDFLPMDDLESGVRADIATLAAEPVFAAVALGGFVFDLATHLLTPVVPPVPPRAD